MGDKKKPWLLDGEMYQYNLGWLVDKIISNSNKFESFLEKYNEWKLTIDKSIENNTLSIDDIKREQAELKQYVNDYFKNLDLNTELSDILQTMLNNGELAELLKDFTASEFLQGSSYSDSVSIVHPMGVLAAGIKNGIAASKIKICIVGDSIPYGSNQAPANTFPAYLANKMGDLADIVNYSIPGENIYDFVDDSYILSDIYSNADYPWVLQGNTWKQIVDAYSPHIIIFHFGTNSWADASVNLRNRTAFQTAINWCSTKSYSPYFCTPIVPNNNKIYYNTEDWIFYNTANAIREISSSNRAGLIDVFAKMCGIARNKISGTITYEDGAMISGDDYYNIIFKKTFDWESIKANYVSFYARAAHDEFLQMSFAVVNNNKILRVTEGYTGGASSSRDLILDITDNTPITFSLVDNKITINNQSIELYQSYQAGAYDLRNLQLDSVMVGKMASNPYTLPDSVTVGSKDNIYDGNGINHPTAFTLRTIYYPFMDALSKFLINAKLFDK